MELLTTHINADFDALAAVVAAQRLHPGAQIFFPGSREESVRRMLESQAEDAARTSAWHRFPFPGFHGPLAATAEEAAPCP